MQKVKDIEANEGRTENWSKAYKQWAESIDTVTSKIKTLKKEQSNVASTQVFNTSDLKANNIAYMSKVHNTIEKQMVEINRLANANGWSDVKVTGVEEASGKIQKLTLTVRDAEGALKQFNMQREKIQGNGKTQAGLVQTGDVKVLETAVQYAEKLKSIETSMGQFGNTTTSITNLENSFTKLGLSTDEVNSKMEAVKTEYATLQNMMSNGASGNEIVNQFEKVNSVLKETQNSLKQTKAEYSLLATEYQRLTLANYIEEWNQKNTAATREVIAQNEIYISSLRDLDVAMTKVEHNNIATSFKQTENSMRALNKLGASFSNQLRQAIDSFKVWVSATTVVMGAVNLIRQIPTVVNELDTALVDLRKTTTMTDAQLKEFYTDAPNIAKQMGVGTKAIIEQASAWSRLGYSSKDAATKMAKYSAMYVLYEQVLKDTDYSSAYQKAMSDYQNYQKQATENGLDSEEAKKASEQYAQNMSEAIQKALENGDDEVANYFESLYPDLQSVVETWKFKAKITPEWDDGSKNDKYDKKTDKEMKEALGAFNNAEEIKNFNSETATEKQKNAMTTLQKIAEQNFHNDIDALVDAAVQLYDFKTSRCCCKCCQYGSTSCKKTLRLVLPLLLQVLQVLVEVVAQVVAQVVVVHQHTK